MNYWKHKANSEVSKVASSFLIGEQWSNDLRYQGFIMTCFQDQRLGQICKSALETNSFAKGIRDLYRFIAPIASRNVTVSPRISPTQFFPYKIFSQNIFLDWAYSGGLLEGGSIFLTGTKNVTKTTLSFT